VNLGHDARVNARPPEFDPAAGKSGEPLNFVCVRRSQHTDTVIAQIAFVIEGSGIAIIARRVQLRANSKARAIGQSKCGDGGLPRPAVFFGSIVAGRGRRRSIASGVSAFS
jgi:hypothetical protein